MKRMKWKKIVMIFLGLGLFCSGCGKVKTGGWNEPYEYNAEKADLIEESDYEKEGESSLINEDEEEGEGEMAEREMTEEQKELLCRISVNEEKIMEGKLYDWQKEILNQYDFAMKYLKEKYPSFTFQIINCEPKNKLNSFTNFTIVEETKPKDYYSLYVDVEEHDSGNVYEAKDNYYGILKEDEFAEKLLGLVQQELPECINVKTNMPYVQGKEYGESLDLDMVLSGALELHQDTTFIMACGEKTEAEYEEKVKELEDFVKERGIAGSFTVKFVEDGEQDEVLYRTSFFGK